MLIGLTGKCCAGKNAVAGLLAEKGIPSIDVDKLGHSALSKNAEQIGGIFGSGVICEDGTVDRKALGSIVFADPAALKKLEAIVHPWVEEETARLCREYQNNGNRFVVVNAALLHKMKLVSSLDAVIWVDAPLFTRIRRALSRDKSGIRAVLKRIYAQRQLKPKPLLNSVDMYRVGNKAGLEPLRDRLNAVLGEIEQRDLNGR